jgi:hypothetical protein
MHNLVDRHKDSVTEISISRRKRNREIENERKAGNSTQLAHSVAE